MNRGTSVLLLVATFAAGPCGAIEVSQTSKGTLIPQPGGANDPFPFVGRVIIDWNPAPPFEERSSCSGTLIAPTLVVTAGHCVTDIKSGDGDVLRVDFGAAGSSSAKSYTRHPDYNPRLFPTTHDLALVVLKDAPRATPIPLLRSGVVQGDLMGLVGYGFDNRVESGPKKAYGYDRIEAASDAGPGLVNFLFQANGDAMTQKGDSGGPGLVRTVDRVKAADTLQGQGLPSEGYPNGWDSRGRDTFAFGALHGNSGFLQFSTALDERVLGASDLLFVAGQMPLPRGMVDLKIVHNLSPHPESLPAFAPQGILVSARYANLSEYVFSPLLFEDDSGEANLFDGFMVFGPESGDDDLAGFGFSAGSVAEGQWVHAWDFTSAGALAKLREHFLEGGLDWKLEFLTRTGPQIYDLTDGFRPASLEELLRQVLLAQTDIAKGVALRAAFDLFQVAEPGSLALLSLGLAGLGLSRRRKA